MANFVVTHKDVGTVAHWCERCASLQSAMLVHQIMEGRVMYAVSLGGAEVQAAIVSCLRCLSQTPVAQTRYPKASAAMRPIQDLDSLIEETNAAVVTQRARLQRLRREGGPTEEALAQLSGLLGHPRAPFLLDLAEANDPELTTRLEAARSGVEREVRCHELSRSIAATYPGAAGLAHGIAAFLGVVTLAYFLDAPAWGWGIALVVGGALARLVISRVRETRVAAFVTKVLVPALMREEVDAQIFLDSIARFRNGGPGSSPALQDMANDHGLLRRLCASPVLETSARR